MSFKSEVQTDDSGKWYSNAIRFATSEEADRYVEDLVGRWYAVRCARTVETDEPANYSYIDSKLQAMGV